MSSEPVISEPQQRGESDMSAHGFPEQGGFIAISASWSPQQAQPPFGTSAALGQVWHYIWFGYRISHVGGLDADLKVAG